MRKLLAIGFALTGLWSLLACATDEASTLSTNGLLTFVSDTLKFDTLFSGVPSATRSVWIYNTSKHAVKCERVQVANGNQRGFRVNVDGIFLGKENGYRAGDVVVGAADSIRVFVEVTPPATGVNMPREVTDDLVFAFSDGTEQRLVLSAWAWDATVMKNTRISDDTTLTADRPILVKGNLRVDSAATLTLAPGTQLFFEADAGLDVYGSLVANGNAGHEVVMQGNRLDELLPDIPYSRLPGQWKGIRLYPSSQNNRLHYTTIQGAFSGIVADSTDMQVHKLLMQQCSVLNCQGYGIYSKLCRLQLENVLIANCLDDCLAVDGGHVQLIFCTLAQFYPFEAIRGAALSFSALPLHENVFQCFNSVITGYADNVVAIHADTAQATLSKHFVHSVLRMPRVTTADSTAYEQVMFEVPADTVKFGYKQFETIDNDKLIYNFGLRKGSAAINFGRALPALPFDRKGNARDDQPDAGAFEYKPS